ncbi:MAG: diguanylate cyclase [Terriglobales bacterium]
MNIEARPLLVPAQAIVEVFSEPTPELFDQHRTALASLLRMALLSGMELTPSTALQLLLDISQTVVASDLQLLFFQARDPDQRLRLATHFGALPPPEASESLIHAWVGNAGKPVLAPVGLDPAMDAYLQRFGARSATATPLFLQHDWVGSLQLLRLREPAFTAAEARLLWILSLLAENQMARIYSIQQLTRLAYTDYLTGLRARGYFEQALEQEVHRALRQSTSVGLLLVDLDNFKDVNDRFGHHAGDVVLRDFARLLARDMRDVDTVARYGGDEFAVILPDTGEAGVRFVVRRLCSALQPHRFTAPGVAEPLQLSISIGSALCPADERTPGQLLRAADLALYQAKQHGKNQPMAWGDLRRTG